VRGSAEYTELDGRHVFVRTSCMQLLFYQCAFMIVFKPMYEVPLQLLMPRLKKLANLFLRKRRLSKLAAEVPILGRAVCP
jgi:hypothetical protein